MYSLENDQMRQRGYAELFKDAYYLLQDLGEPQNTDEFWSTLATRINEMWGKYSAIPLRAMTMQIIIGIIDEIERLCKQDTLSDAK